jgi:hypothetical protein
MLEFVFGMLIAVVFRDGLRLPSWLAHGVILTGLAGFMLEEHSALLTSRVLQCGLPSGLIIAGLTLNARGAAHIVLGSLRGCSVSSEKRPMQSIWCICIPSVSRLGRRGRDRLRRRRAADHACAAPCLEIGVLMFATSVRDSGGREKSSIRRNRQR